MPWDELQRRDLQDTIEHILPQSIDGQTYWQKRFRGKRDQRYVHHLGNLTLTKHNSYYQNKPFPDKKGAVSLCVHCYARSPFYVERELTRWQDWDANAIDKRQAELLEWARERWFVDLSDVEDEGREPEHDEDEPGEDSDLGDGDEEN